MSEETQAVETVEEVKESSEEIKEKVVQEFSNQPSEEYMLMRFKSHYDVIMKLLPLVSNNGLRRVFRSYLKSGVYDTEALLGREEKAMLGHLLQLHDVKYSLLLSAIEASQKEMNKKEDIKQEETTNG